MHNRHSIPVISVSFVLMGVLTGVLATACGTAAHTLPPDSPPVTPVIHTFTSDESGFDTHSYYLDTGAEVVVFDAQFTPALAEQLVDHIRARTTSPIRYLVITHPNPDKFNGARVFRELGARVVASRATAEAIPVVHEYKRYFFVEVAGMFTADTYPEQAVIDITFDRSLRLELDGDVQVDLRVLDNPGVSSTQTVASVPELGAVIVGDLVHHKAHAWLEGGIVDGTPRPDLALWQQALDELTSYGDATIYAGRGEVASVDEAVTAQKAYLSRVGEIVQRYIEELGERRAELKGDQASTHHDAMAARIVEAYPDYALPYMTQYSIYGLAGAMGQ